MQEARLKTGSVRSSRRGHMWRDLLNVVYRITSSAWNFTNIEYVSPAVRPRCQIQEVSICKYKAEDCPNQIKQTHTMLNHDWNQFESSRSIEMDTAAMKGKIPKTRFIILYLPVRCITYLSPDRQIGNTNEGKLYKLTPRRESRKTWIYYLPTSVRLSIMR